MDDSSSMVPVISANEHCRQSFLLVGHHSALSFDVDSVNR